MNNKKYNPFVDTYNFNANSSNWVQRLGHNADFYNNPLGYNSSPTPRPYDNTADSGADDDNEVISGFKPQTPRTTSLNNGFNVNKQPPSMGNMSSFNLKGNNNASDFNANSSNWVQRLGYNDAFHANPLGYNSSPTPRPYDNTADSATDDDNEIVSGFTPQTKKNTKSNKDFMDYFMDNLADIGYGAKKALSGATFGASDWALRKLGLDNEQEYLARKEAEGLGTLTKGLGLASEIGGNIIGAGGTLAKGLGKAGLKGYKLATASGGIEGAAYGLTSSDSWADVPRNMALSTIAGVSMPYLLKPIGAVMKPISNRITRYMGQQNLIKQLASETNFQDVKLGNISDDLANKINNVRNAEGISVVDNTKSIIPAARVEHIRQRRVTNDGYTPQDAAKTVDMALFSKDPRVIKGNVPENQVIFDASNPANKVVINKHPETKGISVVTTMKDKSLGKINKRLGGLPFPPYGANITSDVSTAAGSKIPDFQPLNKNITLSQTDVNPFEKRSFVEAMADRDKARVMRNGVLSGASDLSERARTFQDLLTKRKEGWRDADFEKLVKTPELAKAEVQYAQFMAKNGQKTLSPQKVSEFYERHPIAKDMIAEMREVDPRAFDNILPGSLEEFDMLKKILREEAGNKIKVGASKSGALKRAENALKELMDGEFPGFKDVNTQYASAQTAQDVFESKLRQGLTSVGGGTANTSPFWSGISSPLTAAGVIGGFFNPMYLALTAAGLGGKALMRNSQRAAARRLADGIVRTPVNINPVLANGLSAPVLNALLKYQNKQDY